MKAFKFRLQRIRDLREAKEKSKLIEFGKEQQKLSDEQQKLNLFQTEAELQVMDLRTERQQPFRVMDQSTSFRYMNRIARVIDYQNGVVRAQMNSVERARLRYLDAHRDTKVMDRLRNKRFQDWTREMLREEGKVLDEVGTRKQDRDEL
ncbi:MAG: flagellar export protein FliJ [Calditrichota bacterium]